MQITDPKQCDKYYQALVNRDASYQGSFYVGVKTTSIFCISTCRARKPKRENVIFFTRIKDAMAAGFRACKVCQPTLNGQITPEPIRTALEMVKANPKTKIKDQDLREAGITPETVRRWFNKHYGMTYQCFQRMYRINHALEELNNGESATHSALGAGYDSLSGFGYTFKKMMGNSPTQSHTHVLHMDRLETPLGPMFACASKEGLCLLEFVERKMLETELTDLQRRLKARIITGHNPYIDHIKKELTEYFAGSRTHFTVPLHTPGTEFQQTVWQALQAIPYGHTASYQQQAISIGKPKAVRAVASANGMNRIAIVIPCHRVIGKDGSLTGYAGGLERKRWLLDHEANYDKR
ncbi:bifunctional transcriptional activator/DNA repair enzyme AdaA [Marinibactrum halimedae]|uniref:Methylated-DNA--protein-cysteine methyltransferase n=1 Tax=Marinibactrum halimedae TaxID=1444977 RepID=A0AA37T4G3_9GAMM|nr:methylated-DNA--[protein]-cysteine S-methyltransferase [Marinibactrum halimedae]MCD9457653.1 methylated-DNA--[protein]-cysteine S-methyltransferase [Marinibactrum halimedae]GLS24973.1 XRE family transcriptional regulator [Marinibactrum halimedae]